MDQTYPHSETVFVKGLCTISTSRLFQRKFGNHMLRHENQAFKKIIK